MEAGVTFSLLLFLLTELSRDELTTFLLQINAVLSLMSHCLTICSLPGVHKKARAEWELICRVQR